MKKFLVIFTFLLSISFVQASENPHNMVYNDNQIFYSETDLSWSLINQEDRVAFKKKLVEGAGSYSIYETLDGSKSFILTTGCELVNNNRLIMIDNNLLKYYKVTYDGERINQVELSEEELNEIFPDAKILKISQIDSDDKTWLHKPLFKNKTILLVNDTDKYFHQITCKSKGAQDEEIKGLVTFNRYGIFNFKHFGKRDGKLIFYIR